jgi:hypothetical protein
VLGAIPALTIAVVAIRGPHTASKTAAAAAAAAVDPAALLGSGLTKGWFGEAMTFTALGKKMEVSAEYTCKLCHQALDKGRLEPALSSPVLALY